MLLRKLEAALCNESVQRSLKRHYTEADIAGLTKFCRIQGFGAGQCEALVRVLFLGRFRYPDTSCTKALNMYHRVHRGLLSELLDHGHNAKWWHRFWKLSETVASITGYDIEESNRRGAVGEAAVFLAAKAAGITLRLSSAYEDRHWGIDWWHDPGLIIQVKSTLQGLPAIYRSRPPHPVPVQCQPEPVRRYLRHFRRQLQYYQDRHDQPADGVLIVAPASEYDALTAAPSPQLVKLMTQLSVGTH